MTKVVYEINGAKVTSYSQAVAIKEAKGGTIVTKYEEMPNESAVDPALREKRLKAIRAKAEASI